MQIQNGISFSTHVRNSSKLTNLKFGTLLYDITHQKPAIDIKDGIFYNGIDGYSIRISKKEDHGNLLKKLIIYDHTQKKGNNKKINNFFIGL